MKNRFPLRARRAGEARASSTCAAICAAAALAGLLAWAPRPALASAPVPLSSIEIGDWVEAEIVAPTDNPLAAPLSTREIDIKASSAGFAGSITGPLARDAEGGVTVLDLPIRITAATAVKDTAGDVASLDALADGTIVEARLTREGEDLVAMKIRAREPDASPEIEGAVEAVSLAGSPMIRILGVDVAVAEDAEIRHVKKKARMLHDVDDDELVLGGRTPLGPFFIGADARAEVSPEKNFDLNSDKAKDLTNSDLTGRLEVAGRITETVRVFGKGSYRRRFILEDERGTKEPFDKWEMTEAYAVFLGVGRPEIALQVGRQRFDEKREWLYDENLDGVRLHYLGDVVSAEASASTRLGGDVPELSATWNGIGSVTVAPHEDFSMGAYVIRRTPREDRSDSRLTWLGGRVITAKLGRVRGWAEASLLRGEESGFDVNGHAAHATASLLVSRPGRVMLNLAWARGSGDADLSDGEDGNYRQTGLEDNNDKFGGVTSFRYYGELARPSLSNLEIVTAGLGFRPTQGTSVDLVAHRYQQIEAVPFLRGSDLEATPLGFDVDLGHEVDLILGVRSIRWMRLEYVLAGFWAGEAFASGTERAVSSRVQIDIGI